MKEREKCQREMSSLMDDTVTASTVSSTATVPMKSWPTNGFVAALFCILVSELGDKTFVITTILAMKYSKKSVFLGALTAATLMIALSGLYPRLLSLFLCDMNMLHMLYVLYVIDNSQFVTAYVFHVNVWHSSKSTHVT